MGRQYMPAALYILAWSPPLRLESLSWWEAIGIWLILAAVIVALAWNKLRGMGPIRRRVILAVRLLLLALLVLILASPRWMRSKEALDVMVVKDISTSTAYVNDFPHPAGISLQQALNEYFKRQSESQTKLPDDRLGLISFANSALIDAMPTGRLEIGARAIRGGGDGTNMAGAIQLALASLDRQTLHRLLVVSDGNPTAGDLDAALASASAAGVPIDVMPLNYDVPNAVLVERFIAPNWKREGEAFTLEVMIRSTAQTPQRGRLSILMGPQPLEIDPEHPGQTWKMVELRPGMNVQRVRVAGLTQPGVHSFRAVFEPFAAGAAAASRPDAPRLVNATLDAFTFVRGKGKVLLVDNYPAGGGAALAGALEREGINLQTVGVGEVPSDLLELQNYDAVILANVPRGPGGLNLEQDRLLAAYVRDMGGGLVMIGGPDSFGAGGWGGSEVEKILPVNMDVPARREVGKGALVLLMHSCEMPDGNYWGEQCAIKAVEALSGGDEVGVISHAWNGPNGGGSQWDYPLQTVGDGSAAKAAIKKMQLGDMPSFDDAMDVALNGKNGSGGLLRSNARTKHVIIISDGDPAPPAAGLVSQYQNAKVTVSTVSVYPHGTTVPPAMRQIADQLKGKYYGPINGDFNQLPQIFIKEATIVRRTLIHENSNGIDPLVGNPDSDLTRGISEFPKITGLVLSSWKKDPQIDKSLLAAVYGKDGRNNDPLLGAWQVGLGRSVAFTSSAQTTWSAGWVSASWYGKFWAQVVRSVTRPPMSEQFNVETRIDGEQGKILVEATGADSTFLNFLNMRGQVLGPDMETQELRLLQSGPGVYEATFPAGRKGNYVVVLQYSGAKSKGILLGGAAQGATAELRQLQSNPALLAEIARRTGGRVLQAFDPQAELFSRQNVSAAAAALPIWDRLLGALIFLLLLDVAVRRIAWDWASTVRLAHRTADVVRGFTLSRKIDSGQTIDALKKVRRQAADQQAADRQADSETSRRKFEAMPADSAEQVVTQENSPPAPAAPAPQRASQEAKKNEPPAPGQTPHTFSLLEAKRRAQDKMRRGPGGDGAAGGGQANDK